MPQVTVYVRNADIEKWKSLVKKSEFLHKALIHDDVVKAIAGNTCKHGAAMGLCKFGCKKK